jgi:hypothetical protein
VGSDHPQKATLHSQALDIHLAFGACRKADERIKGEVPVLAEAAVLAALQTLDAGRLVASEKEAVTDSCDGGEVLVEWILHVAQRTPVGEDKGDLAAGFKVAVVGHGSSFCGADGVNARTRRYV